MSRQLLTSLTEIESFNPCSSGWRDILKGQSKSAADDSLFPLIQCLESNSVSEVLWLLRHRSDRFTNKQLFVRFARKCADSVKHLRNNYAYAAAAYAADAAAAAYAAAAYADAAADAAACAAAAAAAADAYAAAYADARKTQQEKNKQFLRECILEHEETLA